ncbi:hypothetical protein D1BOALGB6SA_2238 [Olavius sp. associated proteobacterium Delta 1]|nr:hypothetical protein D1BOALGB6SA_2238 [Olavius sp. associated proteobacterium Delta 1]
MGKWINKSLEPSVSPDSPVSVNHVEIGDLARLADGTVDNDERERLLRHINRCQRCYEILHHTLKDAPSAASVSHADGPWWKTKAAYALAASIILIFIISGQLAYKYWSHIPKVISATLDLDQNLKDILLEDDALRFGKGARLNRLLAALQQTGLPVKDLNLAVLSKPYYQKKSLFGPAEVLHIRIENGVAYLEVQEVE